MAQAVYSTAVLKAENAPPYSSLASKLHSSLLQALDTMGYEYMTPVQQKVLCELPNFRSDCLVQAKTGTGKIFHLVRGTADGTGKTIAFLLPTLHSLLASPIPRGQVGILIMSPTRELALQIAKECDCLTSRLPTRLECHTAFGGTARATNLNRFISGSPAVLVATPGRLKDYLSEERTRARFSSLQTVILDEADTMLEQGFLADVKEILRLLPPKASCGWQGMCFSATIPAKVKDVINVVCKPGYTNLTTIDKSEPPTVDRVPQSYVLIPSPSQTFTGLCAVLMNEVTATSKIIVFGITANLVALYAKVFDGLFEGMEVFQLQSRLSQSVRTRTTEQFKNASTGIMFASDVIGRGMDFPNVSLVIQVGLPSSGQQYVHRVGRTARAGNEGRAVIILTKAESYFLGENRQLPIVEHAQHALIIDSIASVTEQIERQLSAVDEDTKRKAYSSYLGFYASSRHMKPLHLDRAGLVAMANRMAMEAMLCPEPPAMEKSTVAKMGLKGTPGLRYLQGEAAQARRTQQRRPAGNGQISRRGGDGGGGGGGGTGRGGRGVGSGRDGRGNGAGNGGSGGGRGEGKSESRGGSTGRGRGRNRTRGGGGGEGGGNKVEKQDSSW